MDVLLSVDSDVRTCGVEGVCVSSEGVYWEVRVRWSHGTGPTRRLWGRVVHKPVPYLTGKGGCVLTR